MILTLVKRKIQVPGVEAFYFKPSEKLKWQAGQFFHYVLHHEPTDDRGSDRWFTNCTAPFEKLICITTRFTSDKGSTFKKTLKDLKVGDSIEISDLDGDFVVNDLSKKYVFIAGGIGITPFRSILTQLNHEGKTINVTLIYANRDKNIVFKKELEKIARKNANFQIHYVISPERVDENKIKELVPDLRERIFYISGPEPMVDSLGEMLVKMGIPKSHIRQDWFPGYSVI